MAHQRTQQVALAGCLLLIGAQARADVTLVQKTSLGGDLAKSGQERAGKLGAAVPSDQTSTIYLKRDRMRIETPTRVTILDGKRTLVLNPAKKTYQAVPSGSELATNPMLAMMDMKTAIRVVPGGKTRAIAGKSARNYVVNMTMQVGLKPGALPNSASGEKTTLPKIPPITSTTELWNVEFPGIQMSQNYLLQGLSSLPGMQEALPKLRQIKGVSLEMSMVQSVMGRSMKVQVRTLSLSEAPLADALFAPPVGWKQVPYVAPLKPGGFGL